MKYAVNPEGVQALRTLSREIVDGAATIKSAADTLSTAADEHDGKLGPHQSSITSILEEIRAAEAAAAEPVESVSEKLNDVAEGYQDAIDNDPYSSVGN